MSRTQGGQFGPSIGLPTVRYASRTWLAVLYFEVMFSSGVIGTKVHIYWTEGGSAIFSGGASGASLASLFGRSLKRYRSSAEHRPTR